jgi:O-antigen/teichoic acid export membrane protein
VSKTISLQAIIAGVCGLVLVFPFRMWGLLAGWFIGQIVALVFAREVGGAAAPIGFRPGPETRRLLAIGFPIFLFAGLGAVLKSIDRVMILKFLSTQELGYYSIGLMGVSLLLYLPESLGFVLYPRLIAKYSATRDTAATAADMDRPLATIAWLMPLFVGVAVFAMHPLVGLFLPQYLPGVPALSILLFGTLGLALASLPSFYIMAIGKQSRLVPISVLAIVLDLVLIGSFLLTGWKIEGVALGVSAGYAMYGLVLTGYAARHMTPDPARRAGFVARAVLPGVWAVVVFLALHTWLEPALRASLDGFVAAALCSLAFGVLYVAAARRFAPGTGIVAMLRDSNLPGARTLAGVWARETS